jgi:hypothetical protein
MTPLANVSPAIGLHNQGSEFIDYKRGAIHECPSLKISQKIQRCWMGRFAAKMNVTDGAGSGQCDRGD